jgi:hypothetical protein
LSPAPNRGVQAGTAPPCEPAPPPARASGRTQGREEGPATATTHTADQQINPVQPKQAARDGKRAGTSQAAHPGDSAGAQPAKRSRRSHPGAEVQGPSPEQQVSEPGVVVQQQPLGGQLAGAGMELRSRAGRRAPARYTEPPAQGSAAAGRGHRAAARGARATPAPQSTASATTSKAVSALLHLSSHP